MTKEKQVWVSDRQIAERFGVSRTTPWRWVKRGEFPQPVKLTEGCSRWRLSDIEAWEQDKENEKAKYLLGKQEQNNG